MKSNIPIATSAMKVAAAANDSSTRPIISLLFQLRRPEPIRITGISLSHVEAPPGPIDDCHDDECGSRKAKHGGFGIAAAQK